MSNPQTTKIAHSEEAYAAISDLAKFRSAISVLQLAFDPRKIPAMECLYDIVRDLEEKLND